MKTRLVNCTAVATAIVGLAFSFLLSMPPTAQNTAPATKPTATSTPRMPDGHPDLTGFWVQGVSGVPGYGKEELGHAGNLVRTADGSVFFNYGGGVAGGAPPEGQTRTPLSAPSYKPEYAAKVAAIRATMNGDATPLDPELSCKPDGVPRAGVGITEHLQIIQNPQAIAFLWEDDPGPVYRVVYTDGRPHPKDLDTSYMGHSIGHWEGNTLVVDVVGLNDETWLGAGFQGSLNATIHSDKEHAIERWTRVGNELTYEATVDDPVMFTEPWVVTPQHTQLAAPGDYIQPQMCNTNDKAHIVPPGK